MGRRQGKKGEVVGRGTDRGRKCPRDRLRQVGRDRLMKEGTRQSGPVIDRRQRLADS